MGQDRGKGGQFAPSIENDDVLDALCEHAEPIATANDLAAVLGVTSETVRRRLEELREEGRVDRRTVGAAAVVWWPLDGTDGDATDPFGELLRATGDVDLRAEELDAMIRDSEDAWSTHE
jgi:DNA-binding Lrp family transcriptional regulator